MNNPVKCPECGKVIGEYILVNSVPIRGFGSIPCYDAKMDYRKSSHIGFGKGLICKKCAKGFFPEGIAYHVTVAYGKGRITPHFGIKQSGLFATRSEAEEAKKEMAGRRWDNFPEIEEKHV